MADVLKPRKLKIAGAVAVLAVSIFAFGSVLAGFGLLPGFGFSFGRETLNDEILAEIEKYPRGHYYPVKDVSAGTSNYGVTREIVYAGRTVASPASDRSVYCVGLMFDVYMKACARAAGENFSLPKISGSNFSLFRQDWYGVDGNHKTFVRALTDRGLGEEILYPEEAKPGDLIQFWRGSSGHSVVFIGWLRDEKNQIIGLEYWSAQVKSGISRNTEYLNGQGGSINPDRIYIVRPFEP